MSMSEQIKMMKENIQNLNDAGVRRTTFYPLVAASLKETSGEPAPIRRAKAFAYLLDNVEQVVLPYELLAGSIIGMWPVDENVPVYEVRKQEAIKFLEDYLSRKRNTNDEDTVNSGAVSFEAKIREEKFRFALMLRDHYDANIDYHQLQKLISEMQKYFAGTPDLQGYEIGRELERYFNYDYGEETRKLFNELPWNVANHVELNYKSLVKKGLGNIKNEIEDRLSKAEDDKKKEFYLSTGISIDAAIRFIYRYADTLIKVSESPDNSADRAAELRTMAVICRKVAEGRPETFKEAVQLVWMIHIIANIGGGSALSFARFDQYMGPFYKRDMENGTITRNEVKEILCCMWLKVNEPKMRTVQSMSIGGVTPDGKDAANDLTRLCLEIAAEMKLPYPNLSVRLDCKISPQWLYDEAVKTIKAGAGQPMILNDDVWVPNLKRLGYPDEIAREYYNMGCVEIMIQGKQPNWAGAHGITFPMLLENVFKKWEKKACSLDTFEDFMEAYLSELKNEIADSIKDGLSKLNVVRRSCYEPFASALVEGCLEKGVDFFQGGTVCPPHVALGGSGLGTAADSLSAIKKFVYDEKRVTLEELNNALNSNFKGFEGLQATLDRLTPAFGNDDDRVDELAVRVFNTYSNEIFSYNDPAKNEKYVNVLFSYNSHVYLGEITGATPNGRLRGETLSDAVGPSQGKDVEGPTKMLNSILKLDHSKITGAFALNLKVNPTLVKDASGTEALIALIKAYFKRGGPQIQVNFVDIDTLKDAQLHPDKHRDLVVRIAGYCEYFVNLDSKLQSEIIQRTIHEVG